MLEELLQFFVYGGVGAEGGLPQFQADVDVAVFALGAAGGGAEEGELLDAVLGAVGALVFAQGGEDFFGGFHSLVLLSSIDYFHSFILHFRRILPFLRHSELVEESPPFAFPGGVDASASLSMTDGIHCFIPSFPKDNTHKDSNVFRILQDVKERVYRGSNLLPLYELQGEFGLLGGRGGDVWLDFLEGVSAEVLACRIPVEGGFGEDACAAAAVAREDFLLGAEGEGEVGGGYRQEDIAAPGGEGGAEGDGGEFRAVVEGVASRSCQ